MRYRAVAAGAAVLLLLGGVAGEAAAKGGHDEGEVEGLEAELRPAIVRLGEETVVRAEFELDDDGEHEGKDHDEDDDDERDGDFQSSDDEDDDESEDDEDESEDEDDESDDDELESDDDETEGSGAAPATLTVDFGDGSPVEEMAVREAEDDEVKATAAHVYEAEGAYDVTVVATPTTGDPITITLRAQVGRGSARLRGNDRIATAIRLSQESFPNPGDAGAVLLAQSQGFADALASATLAKRSEAPVLLTPKDELPADVLAEIDRALGGPGQVYLLGGPGAISDAVVATLEAGGHTVQRLAGNDRVATAAVIAGFLLDAGLQPQEVVLASATNFPDALAGAAYAAKHDALVLLTPPDALDPRVRAVLERVGPAAKVLVAGGTGALGAAVVTEVEALGNEVVRVAGRDRYETAVAFAELDDDVTTIIVATGDTFPDALAAAGLAGLSRAVVLLVTDHVPQSVLDYLASRGAAIDSLLTIGGDGAVDPGVESQVEGAVAS